MLPDLLLQSPTNQRIGDGSTTASDPLDGCTYDQLARKHPECLYWEYAYSNFRLLYEGGEVFLRAAGQQAAVRAAQAQGSGATALDLLGGKNRRRRFLFQLEGESDTKYISRWERAYYIGYYGAIIDYFRHWLFSQPPKIRPVDGSEEDVPDWWTAFHGNANGGGISLQNLIKQVFLDVLLVRKGGWLITCPNLEIRTMSQQDAESAGTAGPVLTAYSSEQILDWDMDERGEYNWVVLRKLNTVRNFPNARSQVEIFTYVDRQRWRTWEIIKGANDSHDLQVIDDGTHGLGYCPFVKIEVPEGLWPANKLASWQTDMFNQCSMLSYGTLVSCFLQPYLKSRDPGAANRVFGEGELLTLQAASGDMAGEEFGWAVPDVSPLVFQAKRILEQRDEGYRIAHQMSLAVDSQAIGAIARSGASKIEDRRATEIVLEAYGSYVREAIVRTLNCISDVMGDETEWSCDGYDNFQVSSLEEELQTAALVQTFKIGSPTFDKEIQKQVAERMMGHIDEGTKQAVYEEINESVDQAEEAKLAGPPQMAGGQVVGQPGAVPPPPVGMVEQPPKPPGPPQVQKSPVKVPPKKDAY